MVVFVTLIVKVIVEVILKCDLVLISCKWQVFSVELILVFAFDLLQMMASDH